MTDDNSESGSRENIGTLYNEDIDIPFEGAVKEAPLLLEATDFKEHLAVHSNSSPSVEERMESESDTEFLSSLQVSRTLESDDGAKDVG